MFPKGLLFIAVPCTCKFKSTKNFNLLTFLTVNSLINHQKSEPNLKITVQVSCFLVKKIPVRTWVSHKQKTT